MRMHEKGMNARKAKVRSFMVPIITMGALPVEGSVSGGLTVILNPQHGAPKLLSFLAG
jgi:hypothetical protein